jgi:hypothetical protein
MELQEVTIAGKPVTDEQRHLILAALLESMRRHMNMEADYGPLGTAPDPDAAARARNVRLILHNMIEAINGAVELTPETVSIYAPRVSIVGLSRRAAGASSRKTVGTVRLGSAPQHPSWRR